jgi:hypothetical protein
VGTADALTSSKRAFPTFLSLGSRAIRPMMTERRNDIHRDIAHAVLSTLDAVATANVAIPTSTSRTPHGSCSKR